ncbi:MAG: MBL fold metallo-hydrolase [Candidatus Dojkabacteria bacterium]
MIKIKFCGAAKTVTGSNYVVTTNHGTFAVDCGMFQGPDVEHLNLEELSYNPTDLDFALLTHSHIDHSGMLPKLTKNGFEGVIYATSNTIQISTELLLDSAKIQESNFKRGEFYGKYTKVKALVYDNNDAIKTIAKFKPVNFDETFEPADGIKVTYLVAGHILGAASIEVDIEDDGVWKKIIFSGDIGRMGSNIIDTFDREYRSQPDYVLVESLYGGQFHPERQESVNEMITLISNTVSTGGSVFIPSFAVQRTQEILNDLKIAKQAGALTRDLKVWLDSPLAQRVTRIYISALQHGEENLFDFEGLIYVNKYKQSQGIASKTGQVVIAGSGMADGGRIVEHLSRSLENPKNAVIFVGYQAEGTLGRELTEGAKNVVIGSRNISVKAKIHLLKGFSAHGDTNDYSAWLKRFTNEKLKKVFLIHAEIDRSTALKEYFEGERINSCYIPSMQEEIQL